MTMRTLLLGFILGLLTVVNSTPLNIGTGNSAESEDNVYEEAKTEGFIIEPPSVSSVQTESSQENTTINASVQPDSGSAEIPSSVFPEIGQSNTPSVPHDQSSASTKDYAADGNVLSATTASAELPTTTEVSLQTSFNPMSEASGDGSGHSQTENPEGSVSVSSTILTSQPGFTSLAVTEEAQSRSLPQSNDSSSGSGSGDEAISEATQSNTVTTASTTASTTTSTSSIIAASEIIQADQVDGRVLHNFAEPNNRPKTSVEHKTPEWIIIVGFIVGLAGLVLLCAAIATRDKWNPPNKPHEDAEKTNSSNQTMEQEMQVFLHKEEPKEKGQDSEYTVIPLDDLPESYSTD